MDTDDVTFTTEEAKFQAVWSVNEEHADKFRDRYIHEERITKTGAVEMITVPMTLTKVAGFWPHKDYLVAAPRIALLANPDNLRSLNDLRPVYPDWFNKD